MLFGGVHIAETRIPTLLEMIEELRDKDLVKAHLDQVLKAQAEFQKQGQEMGNQRAALEAERAGIERLLKTIEDKSQNVEIERQHLIHDQNMAARRDAGLDSKAAALDKRSEGLDQREAVLVKREGAVDVAQRDLANMVVEHQRKEVEIDRRIAELVEKEREYRQLVTQVRTHLEPLGAR